MRTQRLIGEILVEHRVLSQTQLEEALEVQKRRSEEISLLRNIPLVDLIQRARRSRSTETPRLIGEILVEKGFVNKEQVKRALHQQKQLGSTSRQLDQGQMRTLLNLSTLINSPMNLVDLLTLIMESANEVVSAEASSLMLLDERTKELVFSIPTGARKEAFTEARMPTEKGIAGWVVTHADPLLVSDTSKDPRFFDNFDKLFDFQSKSILCVPMRLRGKILGVLEVVNKKDGGAFDEADLNLLQTFGDLASIAIDNARLYTEGLERQRLLGELQVAKDIQAQLLPAKPPIRDTLDIGFFIQPASEISGDFYDFLDVEGQQLAVLIGDVVGKGIPAAILMAAARSTIRSQLEIPCTLCQAMERANRTLCSDTDPGAYLTLFCGLFDEQGATLTYTNCGHNPPLYLPREKNVVHDLDVGGTVLGAFQDLTYRGECLELQKGDLILLYTDGLTEASDLTGEQFGRARLQESIKSQRDGAAQEIVDHIMGNIRAFTYEMPQKDDQTLVVVKVK